ncbi:MAG: hypothetical protein JSW11_15115 [Candidatus Heimdallarchaeota archaeon]|nr:MAG: hypothetical protein JSW11_15115 [Candidatus Heimdallarchaeota archaeon]
MNETKQLMIKRFEKFQSKFRKQSYVSISVWILIIAVLTIIIFSNQLYGNFSPLRGLIMSFFYAIVLVSLYINIPFLIILIIIYLRARSQNYLFQLIPNFGLQVLIVLAALSNFIQLIETDPLMPFYIIFLLVLVFLEMIFLYWYVRGVRENRKPIFFWTFYQDSLAAYSSTVLSRHALEISEEEDGYSQRPFFLSFSELGEYFKETEFMKDKIREYASFLTEKSELIGWDISENQIVLYPRVLLGKYSPGIGLTFLWRLMIRVLKKNLTYIRIDFDSQEISLKVAEEDYHLLSDVTYHLLGFQVLNHFKSSILAFITGNREEAYSTLFPA